MDLANFEKNQIIWLAFKKYSVTENTTVPWYEWDLSYEWVVRKAKIIEGQTPMGSYSYTHQMSIELPLLDAAPSANDIFLEQAEFNQANDHVQHDITSWVIDAHVHSVVTSLWDGTSTPATVAPIRIYTTDPITALNSGTPPIPDGTITGIGDIVESSLSTDQVKLNLATFDIIATSNQTEFIFDTDFTIDNIDVILNNDSFTLLEDGFDLILETGYGIQQESWYTMGSTEYTYEFITTNNLPTQIKVNLSNGVDADVKVSLVINSIISVPTGYSISQFKDYKISDVTNYPGMRTNIPPPSEITFRPFPL
jgi:hypothetical protein